MRVECTCGRAVPVTKSDAGRKLVCVCGGTIEVPSLRTLENRRPDKLLAAAIASPDYWSNRGCFLCGCAEPVVSVPIGLQLEAAIFGTIPGSVSAPSSSGYLSSLAYLFLPVIVTALLSYRPPEKVMIRPAVTAELEFFVCTRCAQLNDFRDRVFKEVFNEKYGAELLTDYPELKIWLRH